MKKSSFQIIIFVIFILAIFGYFWIDNLFGAVTTTITLSNATTRLEIRWKYMYADSLGNLMRYQEPVRFNIYLLKKGWTGEVMYAAGTDTFSNFTRIDIPDSTIAWVSVIDSVGNENKDAPRTLIRYDNVIVPPPPPPTPTGFLVYRLDNAVRINELYAKVSSALWKPDIFGIWGAGKVASISIREKLYGKYEVSVLGFKDAGSFVLQVGGSTFPILLPISDREDASLVRTIFNVSEAGEYSLVFLAMTDVRIKSIEYRRITVGDTKAPIYPVQLIITGSP